MATKMGVGIKSIGVYLPETVRTNEFWSEETVAGWKARSASASAKSSPPSEAMPGVEMTLAALDKLKSDPFQGSRSRRIMGPNETATDMAVAAAGQALAAAGIKPDEIDLLLSHAMLPDYICVNGASMVQSRVGIRSNVPTFTIDAVCSSAIAQLDLAKSMTLTGQAQTSLLTQVANTTPIMPNHLQLSTPAGDAASAMVVGPVEEGLGLLATAYRSDGSLHAGFVASVPDKRWYEDGRLTVCNVDRVAAKRMQLEAADGAKVVVDQALAKAGIEKGDVALFACYEPSAWLAQVCQERCGLEHANRIATYPWTGSINSASIPMQLAIAQKELMLKKGDIVVAFATSAGLMLSAAVMRWAV